VHIDEGLLVLEEFSPPVVGNHSLLALGAVNSRDRQRSVIGTGLPRMTALPVVCRGADGLAGLCHAVGGHDAASGARCSRAAVLAPRVLALSSECGVVEALQGMAALTHVELDGSRH